MVLLYLYTLFFFALSGCASTVSSATNAISGAFPRSQFALRGTSAFDDINDSYLSNINSDIHPLAIFLPSSSADVARFLHIIEPFALAGVVRVAIRGGGQQPAIACNNIQSGITIDLRNLTGIQVDTEKNTVTIGAGERWGEVYSNLEARGLGVAGGRSALNGINGLTLAGGLSFFSSRLGFISDNVVEFEVVLASGQILRANSHQHADLYKALRGGGNNFGIVTSVAMRTFKQGPFWGGSVFYFPNQFPAQIESLVTELTKPDASPETHIMLSVGYASGFGGVSGVMCLNQLYYTRETHENPAVLKPFSEMQPQVDALNSMRNLTLTSAAGEQTDQNTQSQRLVYMNAHVKADVATLQSAYRTYLSRTEPLRGFANITLSFTLQPYPVSLLDHTNFHGGNSLGLGPSDGPIVSVLFLTWWDNREDDDTIIRTLRETLEAIKADAASRDTLLPFVYLNYAHNFQDPISSYGPENKKQLQAVSKKYDRYGMFQKGIPGGFKLFP